MLLQLNQYYIRSKRGSGNVSKLKSNTELIKPQKRSPKRLLSAENIRFPAVMDRSLALGARVSSLFDIEKRTGNHGSSICAFASEPRENDGKNTKKIYYENNYRLEPDAKFRADMVKPIIEDALTRNLEGKKYDPIECSIMSKQLAEDIKKKVKELDFKRYKIVSAVTIGQKSDQGVRVGSRFLWDAERDNFAASSFSNKHIFAVGEVYAVYYE
ncbi:hypothetical protein ScPMuIL_006676 [Solemya velum]